MTDKGRHVSSCSSSDEDMDGPPPWTAWFLSQPQNDFFCEVDEDYILDRFNLTGLTSAGPHFQLAIDRITMTDDDYFEDQLRARHAADTPPDADAKTRADIQASAVHLYGLIHSRFIITTPGLNKMYEKFQNAEFGKCPRVYCRSFALLPVGMSDIPGQAAVQLYCGHCDDVYRPRSSRYATVDGAYFGTSFPHIFFQQFKQCLPKRSPDHYVPKIFGFKLYTPPPQDDPMLPE